MKKLTSILIVISFILVPVLMFAQIPDPGGSVSAIQESGPTTVTGIFDLVNKFVNWFAAFIAIVAVVMLLYSGYLFMTSAGDPDKLKEAKNYVIYGIIGGLVAAMSWGIASLVNDILSGT